MGLIDEGRGHIVGNFAAARDAATRMGTDMAALRLTMVMPLDIAREVEDEVVRRADWFQKIHRETAHGLTMSPRQAALESLYRDITHGTFT